MYFNREYHIFVSHAWTADDEYNRLIGLLNSDRSFNYRNYSIPKSNPLEINAPTVIGRTRQLTVKLKEQVRQASVVIIIAGMYYSHREWIQKEIEIACEMDKPILIVRPRGQERVPSELTKLAEKPKCKMVYWSASSIILGIKDIVESRQFV